jgi:hypothetical protein
MCSPLLSPAILANLWLKRKIEVNCDEFTSIGSTALARKRDAKALARATDEQDIRQLVQGLLAPERDDEILRRLGRLEGRAVPALLDALRDPARCTRPYRNLDDHTRTSPLEVILDLLAEYGPTELAERLLPLLDSRNGRVREQLAHAFGNVGTDACIEPLTRLLSRCSEYVAAYGMIGMRDSVEAGRATPAFREAAFRLIVPFLRSSAFNKYRDSPPILALLDPEKALAAFLDPRVFRPESENLAEILSTIYRYNLVVPAARLLDLEAKLAKGGDEEAYANVLYLLAQARVPQIDEILARVKKTKPGLRTVVAQARAILDKVPDPAAFVARRLEKVSFAKLTEPQQFVFSIGLLEQAVHEGGFDEYFFNSAGDLAAEAVEGLEAIGASRAAKIVSKACEAFGDEGPSEDCRTRRLQSYNDRKLWTLTDKYYDCPDDIPALLLEYARKHRSHFS